jgi:pSer/pThr/pTyr-binding forkhead associated (FHA) protein
MTLADETVSRWHASLMHADGNWLLADLGSTNGTRVNGWRVNDPTPVSPGDFVSFGAATFVICGHSAAA